MITGLTNVNVAELRKAVDNLVMEMTEFATDETIQSEKGLSRLSPYCVRAALTKSSEHIQGPRSPRLHRHHVFKFDYYVSSSLKTW